jgi:glycosyltransferase involved in cell wall biosynthesis
MKDAPYRICLFHPMDARGSKLGGIETHVRLILSEHPADFRILFIGLDEKGDCRLGQKIELDIAGRRIDFIPVGNISGETINLASKTIAGSTTLHYLLGVLRYLHRIRAEIGQNPASADLQRYEFALIPKLLNIPSILMVHNEGRKEDAMDSLLKRYWFIQNVNEWTAMRAANHIFGVNPNIAKRINVVYPFAASKTEVLSVSIDTKRFVAQPFDCSDEIFRIVFAGRLDAFKDPPLMFSVLHKLHARLGGKLEFHYVGSTDPYRYPEFGLVEHFTIQHGPKPSAQVAEIMARCHAGILTSHFEGMPCYLLEMLASGRPVAAIRLPQFDPLIIEAVSGSLIERSAPPDLCRAALVEAFVELWDSIRKGAIDPARLHRLVEPFSVEKQMMRLFARHRVLQQGQKWVPQEAHAPATH